MLTSASGYRGATYMRAAVLCVFAAVWFSPGAWAQPKRLAPAERQEVMSGIQQQIHDCWKAPEQVKGMANPPFPTIRITLNPDGVLARDPEVTDRTKDGTYEIVAE